MRIDQSALARAEVHQCAVVICLLLSKGVGRDAASADLDDLVLESQRHISSRLEGLCLVAVILVADGEGLSGLNLPAQFVSSEAGDVHFVYLSL